MSATVFDRYSIPIRCETRRADSRVTDTSIAALTACGTPDRRLHSIPERFTV